MITHFMIYFKWVKYMKYLILTDIHGSSKYLDLVLNKVNDFDWLIILGDILYHGPRNDLPNEYNPKKVIEILNNLKEKIIAVRGNCDAEVDLMVLDFLIEQNKWIYIENNKFFLTHGHVYNKSNMIENNEKYWMLYGHYHINEVVKTPSANFINLGSLTIPKDNHHSYAIIENSIYKSYDLLNDEILLEVNLNER